MNELLKLFEGKVELSEEMKEALATLWEAKVAELESSLEAKQEAYISEELIPFYEAKTAEYVDSVVMDEVNRYVSEGVKAFAKKHEAELKGYALTEANSFVLGKMKELFESMSVKVPEGKQDELTEAKNKVDVLESKVEELMQSKMVAESELKTMQKTSIVTALSEDLSDLQRESLSSLLEGIDTDDLEAYERKAKILKESVKAKEKADEEEEEGEGDEKGGKKLEESIQDPWLSSLVRQTKAKSKV